MKRLSAYLFSVAGIALLAGLLAACSGTRLAYETAAQSPNALEAQAYVVSEHYDALLAEANDIADAGAPREVVERMQAADREAKPKVLALRRAVETYEAVRSAQNETELERAIADAALAVSDFIDAIKGR